VWGVIALVSNLFTNAAGQSGLLSGSDQARKLSFQLVSELRNASSSNTGAFALEQAGDQQLVFYSDLNNDGVVERIRYYLSSGKMLKGVVTPTGSPLAYNLGSEVVTTIQNDVANAAVPLFYYYDGSYNGVSGAALAQPVNLNAVRFVQLNLRVYQKAGVTNTNYYTVTASGAIRTLKDNLGN
jgi:hypothetical protein